MAARPGGPRARQPRPAGPAATPQPRRRPRPQPAHRGRAVHAAGVRAGRPSAARTRRHGHGRLRGIRRGRGGLAETDEPAPEPHPGDQRRDRPATQLLRPALAGESSRPAADRNPRGKSFGTSEAGPLHGTSFPKGVRRCHTTTRSAPDASPGSGHTRNPAARPDADAPDSRCRTRCSVSCPRQASRPNAPSPRPSGHPVRGRHPRTAPSTGGSRRMQPFVIRAPTPAAEGAASGRPVPYRYGNGTRPSGSAARTNLAPLPQTPARCPRSARPRRCATHDSAPARPAHAPARHSASTPTQNRSKTVPEREDRDTISTPGRARRPPPAAGSVEARRREHADSPVDNTTGPPRTKRSRTPRNTPPGLPRPGEGRVRAQPHRIGQTPAPLTTTRRPRRQAPAQAGRDGTSPRTPHRPSAAAAQAAPAEGNRRFAGHGVERLL